MTDLSLCCWQFTTFSELSHRWFPPAGDDKRVPLLLIPGNNLKCCWERGLFCIHISIFFFNFLFFMFQRCVATVFASTGASVGRDPASCVTAPQASADPAASMVSLNPSSEITLHSSSFFVYICYILSRCGQRWFYFILLDLNFWPSICPQLFHILPKLCVFSEVWV